VKYGNREEEGEAQDLTLSIWSNFFLDVGKFAWKNETGLFSGYVRRLGAAVD